MSRLLFACSIALLLLPLVFQTSNCNDANLSAPSRGNHNISYPFRLDSDPLNCGNLSYTLHCEKNTSTVLYLESRKYYVQAINYNNLTVRVVDAGFKENDCSSLPKLSLTYATFRPKWFPKIHIRVVDLPLSQMMHSYVNVGGMEASDLVALCSLEMITLLAAKDYKNMPFEEIHSQLAYGFELSWHNSSCGSCVYSCYVDDSYHGHCTEVLGLVSYSIGFNVFYVSLTQDFLWKVHTLSPPMSRLLFACSIALLLLLLVFQTSNCKGNNLCASSCGNHNISYPFRLDSDSLNCGKLSYTLHCEKNTSTVLYLESRKYYVQAINYNNLTIRVVDAGVKENDCSSLPNFSLTYASLDFRNPYTWFLYKKKGPKWLPTIKELIPLSLTMIFMNCENAVNSPLYVDTGTCLNGAKSSNVSLLKHSYVNVGGMKASDLVALCSLERITLLAVKDYKNMPFQEIHSQLAYGFELSWHNSRCRSCMGRCYVDDSYHGHCREDFWDVTAVGLLLSIDIDQTQGPYFAFSWLNDNNTFQAGDVATIKIKVLGEFHRTKANAFSPNITVNGKMGNSGFVSGVLLDVAGEDTNSWRILFTPIRVGVFNVFIEDGPFHVFDSSLHFEVKPGKIYASVCIPSWRDLVNEFEAGAKATVLIVPRDAFGNNVSSTGEELSPSNFTVSELYGNGTIANLPNITHIGWNEFGHIILEFIATKAGNLLLHVEGGNQTLNGCPLPYKVNPGDVL
ncbi:unnamed protein product [Dovyalis caffra]|uniref:Wall-associated receptor kinase galacturonan-binding domain-containing protein n=1 Tax=Dovyalis caffra TaxID=77055 RepID=A0AAV1QM71_9ROSI|nr:unnamed protein product [Dovyalis caffra]